MTTTDKIQVRMQDGTIVAVTKGTPKEEVLAKYERYKQAQTEKQAPSKIEQATQLGGEIVSKAVSSEGEDYSFGPLNTAAGIGDFLLSGVTGASATVLGTLGGAAREGLEATGLVEDRGTFSEFFDQTRENLTWSPRSEQGKRLAQAVGLPFEAAAAAAQKYADEVYGRTDSPALAAATKAIIQGGPEVAMWLVGWKQARKAGKNTAELKKINENLAAEQAAKELEAKHTVEYEKVPIEKPRPGAEPVRQPGSDIPPAVENPAAQTVAPKAAPELTLEAAGTKPVKDFADPMALEELSAAILKDKQVEQGFRELGLRNLQSKYPDRSNKAVNAGKFGQGGAVDPKVFAEGVRHIYEKVKGNKNKFRAALVNQMGKGTDPYAEALYRQLAEFDKIKTATATEVAKGAESLAVATGKQAVDNLGKTVERPGGYAQATVGAVEETAALADMMIREKRAISWDETIAAAQNLGLSNKQIERFRNATNDMHAKVVASGDVAAKTINTVRELADRAAKSGSETDLYILGETMLELGSVVDNAAGIVSNSARALNAAKILKDQGRIAEAMQTTFHAFKDSGNLRGMAAAIRDLDSAAIAKMARTRPTTMGAFAELYVNGLLFGTLTHIRNLAGNTAYLGYSIPQTYLAAAAGKLPGWRVKDPISFRDAWHYTTPVVTGIHDALRAAIRVARTEEPQIRAYGKSILDESSKIETVAHRQITGELLPDRLQGTALAKAFDVTGNVVRLPGRALLVEDAFFKSLAYAMEINRLAHSEGRKALKEGRITKEEFANFVQDYRSTPNKTAMDYAHKMTFTRELGKLGKGLQNISNQHPSTRFVAPFIRTPINLVKEAYNGSPAAFITPQLLRMMKAGGAEGNRAFAHAVMGSLLMYTIFEMANEGKFIGTAPNNPDARKVFLDKYGGAENAFIDADGKSHSLNGIGVFDTLTGIAADAAAIQDYMTEGQWEQVAKLTSASLMNNLLDKTFTQGIFDITSSFLDPERYGYRFADYANTLTTPRIVAQYARNEDPTIRSTRGYAPEDIGPDGDPNLSLARRIVDQVKRDVPGYREDLPPDYDLVGRPKVGHASWVNPFVAFDAQDNPVINELFTLKHTVQVPRADVMGVTLDKQQHAEYKKFTGLVFNDIAQQMIGSSNWSNLPVGAKKEALTKAHTKAKKYAQAMMLNKYPTLKLKIPASKHKEAQEYMSYKLPKYFEGK